LASEYDANIISIMSVSSTVLCHSTDPSSAPC